jgi:polysaccharide deacetylase family protein (PEP-CTERM system associated)
LTDINLKIPLTVDVEDGVNIAMRDHFNIHIDPTSRVVKNTNRLLDLFAEYDTKVTFFTLGQVAYHFPSLIKRMHKEGHEVGVHSYDHIQLFKLSPAEVKEDIAKAKKTIEDIMGKQVKGFRAPAFSINPKTSWALHIIAELGFEYDSSILPASADRYGWPGFPKQIQRLRLKNNLNLMEVPISTIKILGRPIPAAGGGYLRLFPYWFTKWALNKIKQNNLAMIYIHPYEIDTAPYPDYYYEAMNRSSLKKKLLLKSIRYKKETVYPKLESLMNFYSFGRLDNIIQSYKKNKNLQETSIYMET